MPAYLYKAVDRQGKQSSGVLEASNDAAARQSLRDRNLLPLSLKLGKSKPESEGTATNQKPDFGRLLDRFRPVLPVRSLALITRQLATLIGSDIRIEDALATVARQNRSPRSAALLYDVRAAILDGRSFAAALDEQGDAFPQYYRASVAAGEASGRLGAVLSHLAGFVENRQRTARKVQLALLYPALLALVSIAMMVLLLTFVVPDIVQIFIDRGANLPWITQLMIALSNGLGDFGLYVLGAMAIAIFGWQRWLKRPGNKLAWHRFVASHPPTRGFSRQLNSARFAGTLATLLQSGVPLMEALRAAAAVTPNLHFRRQIDKAAEKVSEGASLHDAIEASAVFSPMLTAMVASGENSGNLPATLAHAADDQERELDGMVTALVALVEPGVLLFMGSIILMMVLAILLPIVNLNNLAGV